MLRRILLPTVFGILAYGFWVSPDFKQIAAGVSIFLFGMLSLEDGFRSFTGGVLEKILKRTTNKLWKSLSFGVVTTTLMQSSSLVSVITISFLSAGLLGLAEGIGIIFGANLGTTTGAWLVAGFGLKVKISAYAMPMLVFGIILVFQKRRTWKGIGYILSGLGFLFLGIHFMKEGFEAFKAGVDLTRFAVAGYPGVALFTLLGIVATVIMQSSHATLVLIITALAADQITYPNALALAIGANVGTTITAILGSLSANEQGKRLAAAHLVFNLVTGVLAIALIHQFIWAVDRVSAAVGIGPNDHTLKLAVFHTLFNLLGVVVMVPFIGKLVDTLTHMIRSKKVTVSQPRYLNAAAVDFPDTAAEAVRNEVSHLYDNVLGILLRTLGLTRAEVFSGDPLEKVLERKPEVPPFDVDHAYETNVKGLFSAVIAFISKAAFTWEEQQSAQLHWLRNAGTHLVEAVKDVKHLQKNLLRYSSSPNPDQRAEYRNIRLEIAELLRELEEIRRQEDDDTVLVALDHLKFSVEDLEHGLLDRIYGLIHEEKITPEMGTSLINDYGYACDVLRSLLQAAGSLFLKAHHESHAAQRAVTLDNDELHEVLGEPGEDTMFAEKGAP